LRFRNSRTAIAGEHAATTIYARSLAAAAGAPIASFSPQEARLRRRSSWGTSLRKCIPFKGGRRREFSFILTIDLIDKIHFRY
jgi:hypothetical protein